MNLILVAAQEEGVNRRHVHSTRLTEGHQFLLHAALQVLTLQFLVLTVLVFVQVEYPEMQCPLLFQTPTASTGVVRPLDLWARPQCRAPFTEGIVMELYRKQLSIVHHPKSGAIDIPPQEGSQQGPIDPFVDAGQAKDTSMTPAKKC